MGFPLGLDLPDVIELLPEQMREARHASSKAARGVTLDPHLVELVRIGSAGINACKY
jgi:hypothetical protein